jgi:hypothetical protein
MSGQEIFRVRDGRFAEVWHLEDIGALLRARSTSSRHA